MTKKAEKVRKITKTSNEAIIDKLNNRVAELEEQLSNKREYISSLERQLERHSTTIHNLKQRKV